MKKIILGLAATAAIAAPIALAGPASAATLNDVGTGFVGKGEVQSAYNLNNSKMQALVDGGSIRFSTSQAATQALSQDATQVVTEHGSQTVVRTLSCTVDGKNKHFEAYGTREGDRAGSRDGERLGTLAGSLTGNLVSNIAYDNKHTGQYTGFYLKNYAVGSPAFNATGAPVWNATGTYTAPATFDADLVLGDIEWSGWESEPGENPNDCTRTDTINGVPVVSNLRDETVPVTEVEVTTEYGDESFEASTTTYGTPTGNGPVSLFVTSNLGVRALTITAPLV